MNNETESYSRSFDRELNGKKRRKKDRLKLPVEGFVFVRSLEWRYGGFMMIE